MNGDRPSSPGLASGTLIAERYRVEEEIGRGGMAAVYRARDLRHGSEVAVKVLRPELAAMIGGERFAREVRITASLQHPNIVAIFDSGAHENIPFFVMPLVRGDSLQVRLARERMLGLDEAVHITREVAAALDYAHALGFVHRDVKPANILLFEGKVLLGDFGIARAITLSGSDPLTDSGLALGTAYYMSPEQAAGTEVDQRSDVYSLGCVLYELLAGTPPFTGPPQTVIARHALDTAPAIRLVRPSVPEALEAVLRRAMAKVPGDRFPTAAAFADALESARLGGTIPSPSGSSVRPATAVGRGVFQPALGLALAIAIVVVLVIRTRGALELDANRVVVFPLAMPAEHQELSSLGEDVATIIGGALDGTAPLKWVDGWAALTPRERDDMRAVPHAALLKAARAQRAGYMVTGRLTMRGDSVLVLLGLHDVDADTLISERSEAGRSAEAWRPALRGVNALLPRLVPGGAREVDGDWSERPPAAIAAFLLGEAAFRRVDLATALAQYRSAVRADSTFAFAALRGSQAATWLHRSGDAVALLDRVAALPLPPRYAEFARGQREYIGGRADSAIAALGRAIAVDPDFAEAWMQLGEVYTHLLAETGSADVLADSAFREALRLDPAAVNLLFHPIEIRIRRGDVAGAAPMVEAFLAAKPDSFLARQVEIMHRCVTEGSAAMDWPTLVARTPLPVLSSGISLAGEPRARRCAAGAFGAILALDTAATEDATSRRYFALAGRVNLLLEQGRDSEAIDAIDASVRRWGFGTLLFLIHAPEFPAFRARAEAVARSEASVAGPAYSRVEFNTRLWALGALEIALGRPRVATAVREELERRAAVSGVSQDSLLAHSLAARMALAAGDSAGALVLLEALVPATATGDQLRWDEAAPLGAERLMLARLLLARGQPARAIGVAEALDSAWPIFQQALVPASLALREQAARGRGDPALARRYADRAIAIRRADRTSFP